MSAKQIILGALLVVFSISCSEQDSAVQDNSKANKVTPTVEAVKAEYGSLPLVERLSGNVKAENQVVLSSEISGVIDQIFVENGQFVQKGDLLIKMNEVSQAQQLNQATAGLKIANARVKQAKAALNARLAQYKRAKSLASKNLSSDFELETANAQKISAQADLDLANAQYEQAQALVNERKQALSRTEITAPIDGTVGRRNAEKGMQVSQNTSLITIGNLSDLRIEVILTEELVQKVNVGQSVELIVESPTIQEEKNAVVKAQISRISPFLNESTRTTMAQIDISNSGLALKPGMYIPVDILYGESTKATLIPKSALFTDPKTGSVGVYVAQGVGTEIEPIQIEKTDSGIQSSTEPVSVKFVTIDILAKGRMDVGVNGLKPGVWVVTVGQDLISSGNGMAKVRTVSWKRVLAMQQLQREDLLKSVLTQ
jgi:HlyD family secretion protein